MHFVSDNDVFVHNMCKKPTEVVAETGKYDSFENFDIHYDKHVLGKVKGSNREFGDDFTKDDYIKAGDDLLTSKADYKNIYRKNLSGGSVATYDKVNNELVITQNGKITTFFKPKFGSNVPDAGFNILQRFKVKRR